jgi:hypothetical protein
VDCLVCHEQTGTYKKFPTMAGYPVTNATMFEGKTEFLPPDYNAVAQSVGRPGRTNCGTCHFYGGGGDAVKHGDLDSSMAMPNKQLDVHMGTDGRISDAAAATPPMPTISPAHLRHPGFPGAQEPA